MFERESLLRTGLSRGAQEELELLEDWKSDLTGLGADVNYLPHHRRGFFLVCEGAASVRSNRPFISMGPSGTISVVRAWKSVKTNRTP